MGQGVTVGVLVAVGAVALAGCGSSARTGDGRYIQRREHLLDSAVQRLGYLKAGIKWAGQ